jgi:hypothetical protein
MTLRTGSAPSGARQLLRLAAIVSATLLGAASAASAADWPQLQGNAARTGRTSDSVAPPYRLQWAWMGPGNTQTSTPLTGGSSITIGGRVQPVVAGGRVFVGTMEGSAHGINGTTGQTLWSAAIPGGTLSTAAADGSLVVFVTLRGVVYGFDAATGSVAWTYDTGYAITTSPCVDGGRVYVANHHGDVLALDVANGSVLWTRRVAAPVDGDIAADASTVYVPAENMYVYAIGATSGTITAQRRVMGQTFEGTNPMVFNGKLWVTSASAVGKGSEYAFESVLAGVTSLAQEETVLQAFLNGDTATGGSDASPDWRHYFALNLSDLSEPFVILSGPFEGTGHAPDSMVADNSGRVLGYFKTKFPTLTRSNGNVFGTSYSIDIAAIDQSTGRRVQINNGHLANNWPWETDNLYQMSVAGTYLWLHQRFRGTQHIQLSNSTYRLVQATVENEDGANYAGADVKYVSGTNPRPSTPQPYTDGWSAVAISGTRLFISEPFGIVAIGQ